MKSRIVFVVLVSLISFNSVESSGDKLTPKEAEICLGAHNKLRALHRNTNPLEWDDSLARAAQKYAEKLVRKNRRMKYNKLRHERPSHGQGENLYWQDNKKKGTCADASLAWYTEINNYNRKKAKSRNGRPVGHFTQLVWAGTKTFGVGIATMKSRKYPGNIETYIVAKYSPRGNFYVRGERTETYSINVQPRIKHAKTPTIEALDPTQQACVNRLSDTKCDQYIEYAGGCRDNFFEILLKTKCFKKCGYCQEFN